MLRTRIWTTKTGVHSLASPRVAPNRWGRRLVRAIDTTQDVISDLRAFNKDKWTVRYPHFREHSEEAVVAAAEESPVPKATGRRHVRRSLSFADDPTAEHEVVFTPAKRMMRSMTLASVADVPEHEEEPTTTESAECLIPTSQAADFHLIRLDLQLGATGSSASPAALVSQLERASIANLLDERLAATTKHIDKLRARVEDKSSKVLVTGDLNSGKSTFVNALLRREVMPVDQQPCTTAFCEVHDAAENAGVEEVHIVKDGAIYNTKDSSTFTRAELEDLEAIVGENENSALKVKVFLADKAEPETSLLNNGIVDISLIDAPGLNRDSVKTTAVFARQEEIDVVVFVVSAENHFTLSAQEFLFNASQEKAYVFVVVNKYDGIRDKAKCRKRVLDQLRALSPRTYEHADELVHFVDSARSTDNPAFSGLQAALRTFVLDKRAQSKLNPAATYLSHVLSDVELLVGANAIVAEQELARAEADLEQSKPVLEKMRSGQSALHEGIERIEETDVEQIRQRTCTTVDAALEQVATGVPAAGLSLPSYPGLLSLWDYTTEVRRVLLTSVDMVVRELEEDARRATSASVDAIHALGELHVPGTVEPSKRVFMPSAMFSARSGKKGRRASSALVAASTVGVPGIGLALAQRPELLETTFLDIFDAQYVLFGDVDSASTNGSDSTPTALGVVSVGVGALTMVGGQAMGIRGLIEGAIRLSDLIARPGSRKWAAPLLGAAVLGGVAYVVLELPHTVPRTVGRRIQRALRASPQADVGAGAPLSGPQDALPSFAEGHAERMAREVRKVLRLAGFDLRERFSTSLTARTREVADSEATAARAGEAKKYFHGVGCTTAEVRANAGTISATF
jgi:mitofusin